nr:MAG TPA: hypothetical protein [Caudoviricetes sp.]
MDGLPSNPVLSRMKNSPPWYVLCKKAPSF